MVNNKKQTKKNEEDIIVDDDINVVEENEEEYNVEKIVDVKIEKGQKYYLIKWEGYSSDDNTWEHENDCDCKDLIDEFYKNRNEKQTNKKKDKSTIKKEELEENNSKKRKSIESPNQKSKQRKSTEKTNEKIDIKKNKSEEKTEFYKLYLPEENLPTSKKSRESWENLIDCVESIEKSDEPISKNNKNTNIKLKVYVLWKDGVRSVHSNQVTNNKCPKKMIDFYENHIRFLKNQTNSN